MEIPPLPQCVLRDRIGRVNHQLPRSASPNPLRPRRNRLWVCRDIIRARGIGNLQGRKAETKLCRSALKLTLELHFTVLGTMFNEAKAHLWALPVLNAKPLRVRVSFEPNPNKDHTRPLHAIAVGTTPSPIFQNQEKRKELRPTLINRESLNLEKNLETFSSTPNFLQKRPKIGVVVRLRAVALLSSPLCTLFYRVIFTFLKVYSKFPHIMISLIYIQVPSKRQQPRAQP